MDGHPDERHLLSCHGSFRAEIPMIISKTPLRVSFAGGGTDIADYYRTGYGAVVSSAIKKYVYVTVNMRFDDDIRISYAKNLG